MLRILEESSFFYFVYLSCVMQSIGICILFNNRVIYNYYADEEYSL